MKKIVKKLKIIIVVSFLLLMGACAAKPPILLEDQNDVGLDDWVVVLLETLKSNEEIVDVLLSNANQDVEITYNIVDKRFVEVKPSTNFEPETAYLLEISLDNKQKYNLNINTVSRYVQDLNEIKEDFFIMPVIDDYDHYEAELMKERILSISPKILVSLYRAGVRMKLANGPITDEPELDYLKGVTPRGWEGTGMTWDDIPGAGGYDLPIARIGYSEPSIDHNHGAVNLELHELAHTVDNYITGSYQHSAISQMDEFIDIWDLEKYEVLPEDYFTLYIEEYFAEVFAMYYANEESHNDLQAYAPLTYEFISNLDYFVHLED